MTAVQSLSDQMAAQALFGRVVCGIDATAESAEAARQAARLVSDDGRLLLVGVANLATAGLIYMGAGAMIESLAAQTREALACAQADIAGIHVGETNLVIGLPPRDLLKEAERIAATLLVVGTHGHSRPLGALTGSVASTAVHKMRGSVLVARPTPDPERFPSSIVCGVDDSSEARHAAAVAVELSKRFEAQVRFIVANAASNIDLEQAQHCARGAKLEIVAEAPVNALVAASERADLIVVGSRAVTGPQTIGSVSERVAHQAACSVLVAR